MKVFFFCTLLWHTSRLNEFFKFFIGWKVVQLCIYIPQTYPTLLSALLFWCHYCRGVCHGYRCCFQPNVQVSSLLKFNVWEEYESVFNICTVWGIVCKCVYWVTALFRMGRLWLSSWPWGQFRCVGWVVSLPCRPSLPNWRMSRSDSTVWPNKRSSVAFLLLQVWIHKQFHLLKIIWLTGLFIFI